MPRAEPGFGVLAAALLAATTFGPSPARAEGSWYGEARTEPSAVNLGGTPSTWWTNRLQAGTREEAGALFLAAESQTRDSGTDVSVSGGGHRRLGAWTLSGEAGAGIDALFVPRLALEARVARIVAGTLVAQLGYRYLDFPTSTVSIVSPSASYYFPRGWVELRFDAGRNASLDHDIRVAVLSGRWDGKGSLSAGGGAAYGDFLYDALGVPGPGGRGWNVHVFGEVRLDPRSTLRLDLAAGQEEPSFRQRTLGLAFRRTF